MSAMTCMSGFQCAYVGGWVEIMFISPFGRLCIDEVCVCMCVVQTHPSNVNFRAGQFVITPQVRSLFSLYQRLSGPQPTVTTASFLFADCSVYASNAGPPDHVYTPTEKSSANPKREFGSS